MNSFSHRFHSVPFLALFRSFSVLALFHLERNANARRRTIVRRSSNMTGTVILYVHVHVHIHAYAI